MTDLGVPGSAGRPTSRPAPFRWAVVGVGRHSRLYVIPALAESASGELAALVSSDPDSARRFAERWGGARVYERYEQALADPEIDGVFLITPNNVHRDQVIAAAEAGKHVLCEKPLATSAADAQAMVGICRDCGVVLGTAFHLRHNLVHRRARALIQEGRIGEVLVLSARYAHRTAPRGQYAGDAASGEIPQVAAWRKDPATSGGGAFVSTGSHVIDLLQFLTGAELVDVQARADVDDRRETNLVVAAGMSNGAIATLYGGDLPFPLNEAVISGSLGSIVCQGTLGNLGEGTMTLITKDGEETWVPPAHNVYMRESDAFVGAVNAGREPDASGLDGLRCEQVIEAIYASARTRRLTRVERAPSTNEQGKE